MQKSKIKIRIKIKKKIKRKRMIKIKTILLLAALLFGLWISMKRTRKHVEVPLAGLIFAAVTGFVFLAAINSQTNLLFICFGVMLGCLFLSMYVSDRMLCKLQVTRHVVDHAAAGERIDVHYEITNAKRYWPTFAVNITEAGMGDRLLQVPEGYCMHLASRQTQTVMAHMIPRKRGLLELQKIRISCGFPFGFITRIVYLQAPQKIVIYPRMGTLGRQVLLRARESATMGTMTSASRGGQDEFYGLREYRMGDPVRAIHWKRSARTGDLVIRELTSNVTPQLVVMLDLRGWKEISDGATRAEQAIELAASVIGHAFLENFAVGLLLAGITQAQTAEPRMGMDQRRRLLGALATLSLENLGTELAAMPRSLRKSGAQWVVISLTQTAGADVPAGANVTLLPLDDPQSAQWLKFPELLKPQAVTNGAAA